MPALLPIVNGALKTKKSPSFVSDQLYYPAVSRSRSPLIARRIEAARISILKFKPTISIMRLILSTDTSKILYPHAELVRLSQSDRVNSALKKFIILMVSAIGAILIPVLHFFLVPLLFILSFVLAYKAYATHYRLVFKETCHCIECKKPLKNEIWLDESLRVKCHHCLVTYLLET